MAEMGCVVSSIIWFVQTVRMILPRTMQDWALLIAMIAILGWLSGYVDGSIELKGPQK